jgi:hypothetical protein
MSGAHGADVTPRVGMLVFDRAGVVLGRIDQVRPPDPLAVADDGRRVGEPGDLAALLLPGHYLRQLPLLHPQVAADLVRNGYIRTYRRGDGQRFRYAALSDVDSVVEEGVHLRIDAADVALA